MKTVQYIKSSDSNEYNIYLFTYVCIITVVVSQRKKLRDIFETKYFLYINIQYFEKVVEKIFLHKCILSYML